MRYAQPLSIETGPSYEDALKQALASSDGGERACFLFRVRKMPTCKFCGVEIKWVMKRPFNLNNQNHFETCAGFSVEARNSIKLKNHTKTVDRWLRDSESKVGFLVTSNWIKRNRTRRGGWTATQLEILGIQWPPRSGWITELAGKYIPMEVKNRFETHTKNLHLQSLARSSGDGMVFSQVLLEVSRHLNTRGASLVVLGREIAIRTGWMDHQSLGKSRSRDLITRYYETFVVAKMDAPRALLPEHSKIPARNKGDFYESEQWRQLRYEAIKLHSGRCQCCGATSQFSRLHVDHIKPRSQYPELELDINNLQVLCEDCNLGKGAWDRTDWRRKATLEAAPR